MAVKEHPDRFIGLATLAPQDPGGAARELERALTKLGLQGAKINSNIRGEYLDDRKYWPVFETAERLGVPIYLHPTIPSPSMLKAYSGYGFVLAGPSLGFGAEAALHALRLVYSGVFDRYSGLKIILGHLGEALPFWLHRIDYPWINPWADPDTLPRIKRKPSDYITKNFACTTSGMSYFPALQCCISALGIDHVLFASDYPYENSKLAVEFIEKLPAPDTDKEKTFHSTAESLFQKPGVRSPGENR
ncbi:MAG: amidohydrolase [Chloroflexi bacterium]|nr:amidohydrolase [Chloroflexota bacterium]